MSKDKRIYISGPMSGVSRDEYLGNFRQAERELRMKGYNHIINPINVWACRTPWLYRIVGYRFTLWYDLRLLKRCDNIYMVGNDWHLSRGARLERLKAREWGIEELKI